MWLLHAIVGCGDADVGPEPVPAVVVAPVPRPEPEPTDAERADRLARDVLAEPWFTLSTPRRVISTGAAFEALGFVLADHHIEVLGKGYARIEAGQMRSDRLRAPGTAADLARDDVRLAVRMTGPNTVLIGASGHYDDGLVVTTVTDRERFAAWMAATEELLVQRQQVAEDGGVLSARHRQGLLFGAQSPVLDDEQGSLPQ